MASVQPNYKYYAAETNSTPNYYSQLWGANNTGQSINGLPGVKNIDVDAPEALAKYSGVLKTVLVGVIDTGVDINHPDLKIKFGQIQKKFRMMALIMTTMDMSMTFMDGIFIIRIIVFTIHWMEMNMEHMYLVSLLVN